MKTIEEIDKEIEILTKKLREVKGTPTEVYTRIVGYYRNIENWNKGKREEYHLRKTFKIDSKKFEERVNNVESIFQGNAIESPNIATEKTKNAFPNNYNLLNNIDYYIIFTREFCRNCPPVKEYLKNKVSIKGEEIDVSNELGLSIANKYNVMSTPTVIFFDKSNNELFRVHSLEQLKEIFSDKKEKMFV